MQSTYIRGVLFVGLAAFVPLFYYLAVVGGLLPYGGILLIAIRNIGNSSILWFSLIHLTIYGVALYWLNSLRGSSSEFPEVTRGPLPPLYSYCWRVLGCPQFSEPPTVKSIG